MSEELRTFEPMKRHRWVAHLPTVDAYVMKRIKSVLVDGKPCIELAAHCVLGQPHPFLSLASSPERKGELKLINHDGSVLDVFSFSWKGATWLPFDLDYASGESSEDRIVLHDVEVTESV